MVSNFLKSLVFWGLKVGNTLQYFITFYIRNVDPSNTFCKTRKLWMDWGKNAGKEPLHGKYFV